MKDDHKKTFNDMKAKRLYRSSKDVKVAGVCAGLAEYFNIDPTIVRVFFVVLLLPGGLPGLIPYLILWLVVPVESSTARKQV